MSSDLSTMRLKACLKAKRKNLTYITLFKEEKLYPVKYMAHYAFLR